MFQLLLQNDLHVFNQNAESRGNTRHQVSYDDSMVSTFSGYKNTLGSVVRPVLQ